MFAYDTLEDSRALAGLNDEQRVAADHDGGHLLVLAGAGTGKTTTLCARVARLVERGVPHERILLLTFTRRAAREMVDRARAATGGGTRRVLGGTFHSVGHRLVREHATALGLSPDFALLDSSDAADVLDLVRQEHGHSESSRRFPRKSTLIDIYSRTVNAQRPLREVLDEDFPWCAEHADALVGLFRGYTARKRALGMLDLDDLLVFWRALMVDPGAAAAVARGFDHVLVDEYQDVNRLQVEIVSGFASGGCAVTAVGDDFQAIYGFRSASARFILGFPEQFADARTVTLHRNYRATQPLLDVANAVSAQGMLLREQAVLARTGHDTDLLELELSRRGIPYRKYGGLRYLDAAHVKDLLASFRLVERPGDQLAWFRLLQLIDGVGPGRARRTCDLLLAGDASSLATLELRWLTAREELPLSARNQADAVVAAVAAGGDEDAPGVVAERLRDAVAPLVRAHYIDGATRVIDLDVLCDLAARAPNLRTFVAELVLDPPSSSGDLAGPPHLDDDWLVLSTIHSAKGLEWQSVHLIAAYDGNFPACMSAGSVEEIAEERRLFYVGLTRARRELAVYVPRRYYHRPGARDDAHGYGKASRFLDERAVACCAVTQLADDPAGQGRVGGLPAASVTASVDGLFV